MLLSFPEPDRHRIVPARRDTWPWLKPDFKYYHEDPGRDVYHNNLATVCDWLEEPLSNMNKEYRFNILGRAFGLHSEYMQGWYHGHKSIGSGLIYYMAEYCHEHSNVGHNNPIDDITFFATLNTNDG